MHKSPFISLHCLGLDRTKQKVPKSLEDVFNHYVLNGQHYFIGIILNGIVEHPGWWLECLPFYGNVTALLSCYIASLSHITQVIARKTSIFVIGFSTTLYIFISAAKWISSKVINLLSIPALGQSWFTVSDVILQVCRISTGLGNFRH